MNCFETGEISSLLTLAVPLKLRIKNSPLFEVHQLLCIYAAITGSIYSEINLSGFRLRRDGSYKEDSYRFAPTIGSLKCISPDRLRRSLYNIKFLSLYHKVCSMSITFYTFFNFFIFAILHDVALYYGKFKYFLLTFQSEMHIINNIKYKMRRRKKWSLKSSHINSAIR